MYIYNNKFHGDRKTLLIRFVSLCFYLLKQLVSLIFHKSVNMSTASIGIDLGTTFSCAAVVRNGKVEVIPCDDRRTTPSMVAYTDAGRLVGYSAKTSGFKGNIPGNVIFGTKRLIGRKFEEVSSIVKNLPYSVINRLGEPRIRVTYKDLDSFLLPQQISAIILIHLVKSAERYLGKTIKDVVITVPAYFNSEQRAATEDAGKIAGLNVLALISEPTAAAIAYGLEKKFEKDQKVKNILIFDFGGGTFDVSILVVQKCGDFEVKATGGDPQLGGEDINDILVDLCFEEFNSVYSLDARSSKGANYRLREACEIAKCVLSDEMSADISISGLFSSKDLTLTISRETFNIKCSKLFDRTIEIMSNVLHDAKFEPDDIDEVVMVGGSSNIPKVKELVKKIFPSKKLVDDINPDECVAFGAAVRSHLLGNDVCDNMKDILLKDVTPLTLGVEIKGNVVAGVIKKNQQIPCEQSIFCTTSQDNQTSAKIKVYAGERAETIANYFLGEFELTNIPKAPRMQHPIKITFNVNENGILTVSAVHEPSGISEKIDIKHKSQLTQNQIDRMIASEKPFEEDDRRKRSAAASRQFLENFLHGIMKEATEIDLTERERNIVDNVCNSSLRYIESNFLLDEEECAAEMCSIRNKLSNYMTKLNLNN